MAKSALVKKQIAAAKAAGMDEKTFKLVMAPEPVPETALATRIPEAMHRAMKVFCATHDILIRDFVVQAIQRRLDGEEK
jgi:hypothetical protein